MAIYRPDQLAGIEGFEALDLTGAVYVEAVADEGPWVRLLIILDGDVVAPGYDYTAWHQLPQYDHRGRLVHEVTRELKHMDDLAKRESERGRWPHPFARQWE